MSILISAATVVAAGSIRRPGWIEVDPDAGAVVAIGAGEPPRPFDHSTDRSFDSGVAVPGFVDIHVHGGGGGVFGAGPEGARAAIAAHRAEGSTTMLGSLVSAHPQALLSQVSELAELVESGELSGIHLEGPWLSPERLGAHDETALRAPEIGEIERVLTAARGTIRVVTIAPELPGGLSAIRYLVERGVVAAVGHTEATYDQAKAAVEAGATLATHLFNAMRPIGHREPGPVIALVESPTVTVEMILDAIHVHPAIYGQVRHWVGPDRLALVTDAMAAAGQPDGEYRLGTVEVIVTDGVARVRGSDTLAGSTATTAALFRHARQFAPLADIDPDEALLDAVRQTSANPARVVGLSDRDLRPGGRADLVVLDPNNEVTAVMRDGRWQDRSN